MPNKERGRKSFDKVFEENTEFFRELPKRLFSLGENPNQDLIEEAAWYFISNVFEGGDSQDYFKDESEKIDYLRWVQGAFEAAGAEYGKAFKAVLSTKRFEEAFDSDQREQYKQFKINYNKHNKDNAYYKPMVVNGYFKKVLENSKETFPSGLNGNTADLNSDISQCCCRFFHFPLNAVGGCDHTISTIGNHHDEPSCNPTK
jgi:hypothetical protein